MTWFRALLAAGASLAFATLCWLATHLSSTPDVLGRYSTAYFSLLAGVGGLTVACVALQFRPFYPRLHRARREVSLLLGSLIVSLVLAEAALRIFDPLGLSYFEETRRYERDKLADPMLVYRHTPGLRRTYQGAEVTINEAGHRDRPPAPKFGDELRILLLGDSVTFGWGVAAGDTFGRRMERLLGDRLGRPVRTVNSAVGSYNTVQQLAVLRTQGRAVDADVVVLVYVDNDVEPAGRPFDPWSRDALTGQPPPGTIAALLNRSWIVRLARFSARYGRPPPPAPLDHDAPGVRASLAALKGIADHCRVRGIDFVTFYYRPPRGPQAGISEALFTAIAALGRSQRFPVVDTGPWWDGVDVDAHMNSVIDSHPNARGHALVASGIVDFLAARLASGTSSARPAHDVLTGSPAGPGAPAGD